MFVSSMFITTHALIGAVIGNHLPSAPWLAFVGSLAAHFIADIIPHGDSGLYKGYVSGSKVKRAIAYVTLDALVAMIFVLALFNTAFAEHRLSVSLAIIGGVLPDLLVAIYEVLRIKNLRWFHRLHFFFHNLVTKRHGDVPFAIGVTMQVSLLALILTRVF